MIRKARDTPECLIMHFALALARFVFTVSTDRSHGVGPNHYSAVISNLFLREIAKREHAAMCVCRLPRAKAAEAEHSPSLAQGMVGALQASADVFDRSCMTGKLCC
jgi:hypothetical protein